MTSHATPLQSATTFLAARGLTLERLLDFTPRVAEDECLVLCGPVVEGLANGASDIDIIYLGQGGLKGDSTLQLDDAGLLDVAFDASGNEINVERYTLTLLEEMARLMQASVAVLDDPQKAHDNAIEKDTRRLKTLHRIWTGVPLVNPGVHAAWQARLGLERLHEHQCMLALLEYFGLREDVLGELNDGRIESACWIARTVMAPRLGSALLHSVGVTNPAVKWQHSLLQRHKTELGEGLVSALVEFVHRGPAHDGRLLLRCVEELDAATAEIQSRLRTVRRAAIAFGHTLRYAPTFREQRRRAAEAFA